MTKKEHFTYRQDLIDKARLANEEAIDLIFKKIEEGHFISGCGSVSGPYATYRTYFISDGTAVQIDVLAYDLMDLSLLLEQE